MNIHQDWWLLTVLLGDPFNYEWSFQRLKQSELSFKDVIYSILLHLNYIHGPSRPNMADVWPAGRMRPFNLFLRPANLFSLVNI